MQSEVMRILHSAPVKMSEDCLYLNIWRPRKPGVFPVMVWIHGGGYFCGTATSPMYFGDRLAANGDVVVVTINYRLNAFGFLAHEAFAGEEPHHSTGNYGTLDQVAAVQWVHDNIHGFGGDPDNVTLFGQSAGGWSVCTLLATPLAGGLFHRAILESGGCNAAWPLEKGLEDGAWTAEALGCSEDPAQCMRGMDAKAILKKADPFPSRYLAGEGMRFINHVDGYVLTGTPLSMIQSGDFNKVPLLAGSTRDEFQPLIYTRVAMGLWTKKRYESAVRKRYGRHADHALRVYPADAYGSPAKAFVAILGDRGLICPTYEGLRAVAAFQPATYYYRFDYDGVRFGRFTGAMHVMEVPFVFQNMDRQPMDWLFDFLNIDEAMELSRVVQRYWVTFARAGDPNDEGLAFWPQFRPQDPKVQVLDETIKTTVPDNMERCAFCAEYDSDQPAIFAADGLR